MVGAIWPIESWNGSAAGWTVAGVNLIFVGTCRHSIEDSLRREKQMAPARPRRAPIKFHTGPTGLVAVTLFPAAVAGEQYARYAKSVWAQAHRWLEAHWNAANATATTALDARLKLRAIAATDVKRHLHPQEEQLLSEMVHAAWNAQPEHSANIDVAEGANN